MPQPQPAILLPIPAVARYLFFVATPSADLRGALKTLATLVDGDHCVAGLGASLVASLGARIPGLHSFPALQSTRAPEALTMGAQPLPSASMKRAKSCGLFFSAMAPSLA